MRVNLITTGIVLIVLGMLMLFVGILAQSLGSASGSKSEVRGGGVILIGQIPIVFGTDANSVKTVLILAIILMLVVLLVYSRWMR
ncbi:MAG: DUF131 domain-containing protein [Candidatus Hydrothermarchaeales archaeon]